MGFVTFSTEYIGQMADEMEVAYVPDYASDRHTDPLTRELVLALIRNGSSDRLYSDALANSLLVHHLTSANKRWTQGSSIGKLNRKQLQRAMDYLQEHLGQELDLQSWAKEVGLSPYHFAPLFRRTTGLAPHQFALRHRVERAKSILATGDTSLSGVAYDLGFSSQSHFNRVFRQYRQMTPGEWRNATSF